MSGATGFWRGLDTRARMGLGLGAAMVLLCTVVLGWWLMRVNYQVLFADLKPQDAQAMTSELERLKIPYRLGDAGTSILVDERAVHATRIKLLGRDVPLHGSVGLELFNNTDFGMTEFTQKVNFQRALQGEITRTIQSLAEIHDVRVLLAMPEQGLFKQATARPKASITLSLKPGRALRNDQIVGIQRLVAAAVPGMAVQDVTLVDGNGVALTRAEAAEGDAPIGARLELKRETENYLQRKLVEVLERTYGPGQALASVDVTLSMDQVRTTTEDVLPASGRSGLQTTGVIVRDKEVLRDPSASERRPMDTVARSSGASQRDTEYAVGRRVEQVVGQPGAIRRIHVVAVLRQVLDAGQEDKLRSVLSAAVGAMAERGDTVVVQSLSPVASASSASSQVRPSASDDLQSSSKGAALSVPFGFAAATGVLVVMLICLVFWIVRAGRPHGVGQTNPVPRPLSLPERQAALARIRAWLETGSAVGMPGASGAKGMEANG